jgi:hypothetical protein
MIHKKGMTRVRPNFSSRYPEMNRYWAVESNRNLSNQPMTISETVDVSSTSWYQPSGSFEDFNEVNDSLDVSMMAARQRSYA